MKNIMLLLVLIVIACTETGETIGKPNNTKAPSPEKGFYQYISSLKLPDKLDFCGEKVPLEIPEVKERAEREFYLLLQQPGQIILYLKRSGRYFPMFEKVIKEMRMPDDIKYLSVAESALYMARSPKGAVGLWQFMKGTARHMGLQVDEYVDERRHPEKSTRAAMKYLRSGFKKRKSWTLAAAGYNMGHGGLNENLDYQSADDFYDLYLNEETSRYILRIVIIKELMKNHKKYGFNLTDDDLYKPDKTREITVDDKIENLSDWAISKGTSYKFVKLLNPWILKRELPKPKRGESYIIDVPAD